MSGLKLEEKAFEFEDKTYILRCNMAVLEDVQEEYGGDFARAMEKPRESMCVFLKAMLNDYAEEQGWPERFTTRDVKRKVTMGMLMEADIIGLTRRSIIPPGKEEEAESTPAAEAEGN